MADRTEIDALRVMSVPMPPGVSEMVSSGIAEMANLWEADPFVVEAAGDQMDTFASIGHGIQGRSGDRVIQAIVGIDDSIRYNVRVPRRTEVVHDAIEVLRPEQPVDIEGLTVVGSTRPVKLNVNSDSYGTRVYEANAGHFLLLAGEGDISLDASVATTTEKLSAVVIHGHIQRY